MYRIYRTSLTTRTSEAAMDTANDTAHNSGPRLLFKQFAEVSDWAVDPKVIT